MSSDIKASMSEYYNERAEEYEEVYTLGKGPASIPDPEAYKAEVNILAEIVRKLCYGRIIDIGCGTGFWLPYYFSQSSHITLIDQSAQMLSECKKKIASFLYTRLNLKIPVKNNIVTGVYKKNDLPELKNNSNITLKNLTTLKSNKEPP